MTKHPSNHLLADLQVLDDDLPPEPDVSIPASAKLQLLQFRRRQLCEELYLAKLNARLHRVAENAQEEQAWREQAVKLVRQVVAIDEELGALDLDIGTPRVSVEDGDA